MKYFPKFFHPTVERLLPILKIVFKGQVLI